MICDGCENGEHEKCEGWCECTECQVVVSWHGEIPGGGRTQPHGQIQVKKGEMKVFVDDDYYSGTVAPEDARRLAEAILKQVQA